MEWRPQIGCRLALRIAFWRGAANLGRSSRLGAALVKRSARSVLQTVHLWLGLALGLPLIVIGLSGSALLLQREIVSRSLPAANAVGENASLARVVEAARALADREVATIRVQLLIRDGAPTIVQLAAPGRGNRALAVYVDPVSAEVLGSEEVGGRGPVLRFLVNLHAFLMLSPPIGLPVVGWMGVVTLFMSVSGLILWWPRAGAWRRALWVSRGARGLRLHLDLHHAVGFWGFLVLLIISFSGIYLCFPQTVSSGVRYFLPAEQPQFAVPAGFVAPAPPLDADKVVAAAMTAVEDARVVSISLPGTNTVPYVVEMEPGGLVPAAPPIFVMFEPESGALSFIDDPRGYNVGSKFLNWQHALHFAVGFGWPWKILVFLSGLLPLLLAVTGTAIWWKKRRNRKAASATDAMPVMEPAPEAQG